MNKSSNTNLPHGIIFDVDGVLVDSEDIIAEAARMMFEQAGLKIKREDFLPFVGTGEKYCLMQIAKQYNFELNAETAKNRTYDIYLDIIKGVLQPLPGVHEFIKKCETVASLQSTFHPCFSSFTVSTAM